MPIRHLAMLTLLITSWVAPANALEFTKEELAVLQAGKTVRKPLATSGQNGYYGGTGWTVINATTEVIWRALRDFNSYPGHFPNTVETTELSRRGNRTLIRQRLGYKLLNVVYHCSCVADVANNLLSFELEPSLPHDILNAHGYWRLFPQAGGRTIVGYGVSVQVPLGIVNILGSKVERALHANLIGLPYYLKKWVEGPDGDKYRHPEASTSTLAPLTPAPVTQPDADTWSK